MNSEIEDRRQALVSAISESMKAHSQYFPSFSRDDKPNQNRKVNSLGAIEIIQAVQHSNERTRRNRETTQLEFEWLVTISFLNYQKAEEALQLGQRMKELIDRNLEVMRAKYLAERAGDKDLKLWRSERKRAIQSIVDGENNLKVARVLLNVLMNYPPEQQISLEAQRFGVEATQKFYSRIFPTLSDSSERHEIFTKITNLSEHNSMQKSSSGITSAFTKMLSAFDNLVTVSRQLQMERLALEQAVTHYDASEISFNEMHDQIHKITKLQLVEISVRYEMYESMSELSLLIGWSAFDSGMSFTNRIEKLIIEGE
jgi:hypothetical protein